LCRTGQYAMTVAAIKAAHTRKAVVRRDRIGASGGGCSGGGGAGCDFPRARGPRCAARDDFDRDLDMRGSNSLSRRSIEWRKTEGQNTIATA